MKTQSAKAKGRRLQQWVRDLLIEKLDVHPEDVESRSMGAGGEDLIMARAAREKFPYSIECKNQEKVNVWESYSQAVENSKDYEPVVASMAAALPHLDRFAPCNTLESLAALEWELERL